MANDQYEFEERGYGRGQNRGDRDWPYSDEDRRSGSGRDAGWGGAGGPGFSAAGRYGQAYSGAYNDGDDYGEDFRRGDPRRYGSGSGSARDVYGEGRPSDWSDRSIGRGDRGSRPSGDRGGYHGRGSSWDDPTRGYGRGSSYENRGGERDFMDRAADEVSSWFGDDAAARRREDDHRGKGPRGYQRSDQRIEEDVNDRLTDDPMLDASDIDVAVSGREVTLSGEVRTREAKRRAEDCAEAVSGVTHVQNNLRVRAAGAAATTAGGTAGI